MNENWFREFVVSSKRILSYLLQLLLNQIFIRLAMVRVFPLDMLNLKKLFIELNQI